jgi:hypothetical protein
MHMYKEPDTCRLLTYTNKHYLYILGMHRVKMYHLRRKVHFVIMTSVFDTPEKIHTVYDLKGSLIGRQASPKVFICVYIFILIQICIRILKNIHRV